MSTDLRKGSHTVSRLTCHVIWVTKYRFKVLKGDIQKRCHEILIPICEAEGIEILKGVVSSYHVHMPIE
jgi:putative transposase